MTKVILALIMFVVTSPFFANADDHSTYDMGGATVSDKLLDAMVMRQKLGGNKFDFNSSAWPLLCKNAVKGIEFGKCEIDRYSPTSYKFDYKTADGVYIYNIYHNEYGWTRTVKIRTVIENGSYCIIPGTIINSGECNIKPWQ